MSEKQQTTSDDQRLVAAVDLGSNSFHLIVASIESNGSIKIIDRIKEMVRLGAGLDENNCLDEVSQQRALDCLSRFSQRLQNIDPRDIRIAGTNTLRIAKNKNKFIKRAKKVLDHKIEIITGVEEARLVYHGVIYSLSEHKSNRLVIDIGGGSTEVIIGKNKKPIKLKSIHAGSTSITKQFFNDGVINKSRIKKAELFVMQEFEEIRQEYLDAGWDQAVGTSGSIRSISKVLLLTGLTDGTITKPALKQLMDTLIKFNSINKIKLDGLTNERQPMFIGGVVVLNSLFKILKIKALNVSDGAIREGLMLDIVGRIQHRDIRSLSVEQMAERFSIRASHADNIITTCDYILKQLNNSWIDQDNGWLQMIRWAAQLHEIGLSIAHSRYQKHSAYLVQNSNMPGFSIQEQQLLSTFVRNHRKSFLLEDFEPFSKKQRKKVFRALIVLRLAIVFNRSVAESVQLTDYQVEAKGKMISLKFPSQWFEENALTITDLQTEAKYLNQIGYKLKLNELN